MRSLLLIPLILFGGRSFAQTEAALPTTLPQLASILPALVHSNRFQLGPFSDAVDKALRDDPTSAAKASVICASNLSDPNEEVQVNTLTLLHVLALRQNGPELVAPAVAKITAALDSGSDMSKRLGVLIVSDLNESTPDSMIPAVERLLSAQTSSDRLLAASAEALAHARPTDDEAQSTIANLLLDNSRSVNQRNQVAYAVAFPKTGTKVVDSIVQLANTSPNIQMRDSAITAATRIGPGAVNQLRPLLTTIMANSSESLSSHRTANHALKLIQ